MLMSEMNFQENNVHQEENKKNEQMRKRKKNEKKVIFLERKDQYKVGSKAGVKKKLKIALAVF